MRIKKEIMNFIWLCLGCLLIALTFNIFCVPNNYVVGGISGIGIVFNYLFNISASYVLLIGNLIVTLIGILVLGIKDTGRSIIGSIIYTICVYLTENLSVTIDFSSVFLDIVVIGVLFAIGSTIVYLANYTTGGTDLIALILTKKFGVTPGNSQLIVNSIVLALGTIVFGIEMLVITLIIKFLQGKIIDVFLLGISDSKVLFISTNKVKEVKEHIIKDVESGVSEIKVTNGYKNTKGEILMCVVPTEKYLLLKKKIVEIDKNAFVTVIDSYEVYGGTNRYKLPFHSLKLQ